MSMNYVGSISILDRGDSPAQAIIDKNKRSMAQRIADETKDELEKVMHRVEDIYVSYEQSTQDMFMTHGANVEYIEDIKELEEILNDQLKKKKYEQRVTVFIVGFENMSNQRLKLIQQVNEFFMDATRPPDEEEAVYAPSPDIDLEEVGHSIEETLDSAERLADRLGELNTEMCDWLTNFAINKASNKRSRLAEEGKKKLERALSQAKDDLSGLNDKLLKLQGEMEVKEDKVQQLLKQMEIKTSDTQKYRTAAEAAKKSIQELEEAQTKNEEALKTKDKTIRELNGKLQMLELEVGQTDYMSKKNLERNQEKGQEMKKKLEDLQEIVDTNKAALFEAQRDWQKLHDQQVLALTTAHREELEALKAALQEEQKKSKDQISETEQRLLEAEKTAARAAEEADKLRQNLVELQLRGNSADSRLFTEPTPLEPEDDSSHLESRPSTKSSKQSTQPLKQKNQPVKLQQKSAAKVTVQKETAESSIQDEGGDHSSAHVETRQSKRGKSTLDPVPESELYSEFPDKFELSDENSWATIPKDQIPGRFTQYRKLTQQKVADLEEQLNITLAKTQRKVNTLKSQFQEHKSKWEAERSVLIEQVEQAHKLQTEAEKEADDAMTQLEEFINEQERLEEEEEGKRIEISKGISRPVPKVITPPPPAAESPPPTAVTTEGTEQELKNLMQQTDDAKSQRQRSVSVVSSGDLDGDIAPWLIASEKRKSRIESSSSQSEEDVVEEPRRRSSLSKSSFHSKAERLQSELSRLTDPNEADEDANDSDTDIEKSLSQRSLRSRSLSQRSMTRDDSRQSRRDPVPDGADTSRSSRKSSIRHPSEMAVPSRASTRRRSLQHEEPPSKPLSRRSSLGNLHDRRSRQSVHQGMGAHTEEDGMTEHSRSQVDEELLDDEGSRQTRSRHDPSHMSSRRGSRIDEDYQEVESHRTTGSRSRRDPSNLSSRKGTMVSRGLISSEELEVLGDEEEFEEDINEKDVLGFDFNRRASSRVRSQPTGSGKHVHDDATGGRETAPGRFHMERRGSQMGRSQDGIQTDRRSSLSNREISQMSAARISSNRSSMINRETPEEAEARITSGAMSAPPAVEPEAPEPVEEVRKQSPVSRIRSPNLQDIRSPHPNDISTRNLKTLSHRRMSETALPIQEISEVDSRASMHSRDSAHKDAWLTPRVTPAQGRVVLSATPYEDGKLPNSQETAVNNVKLMMEEENLSNMQHRTLESVRNALQKISVDPILSDVQLERTLTIISLASQLTEESLQLGVLPDTVFDQFAELNSRAMSEIGISEDDFRVSETPYPPVELLRPLTRDSLSTRDEPSSMMTFLQELSYTSLHPLPPLHGYLSSSQSHRMHRQRSGLSTRESKKMRSASGIKPSLDKNISFATMATGGSSLRDTFTTSSKDSMRMLASRGRETDSMYVGHGGPDTELDIMMMDTEVYSSRSVRHAQTQTDPELGTDLTDDDIRMASAQSRASLRSQYKNRLEETRHAIEERRSKSPAISVPSQRSLEEDQLVEEDDFPIPDEIKEEIEMEDRGTSPPPGYMTGRKQSTAMSRKLVEHPIVGEYLKTYEGVLSFKENLSRVMLDKEMLQASEILQDLDIVNFDVNSKVQPQLENMTKNVYFVLEEISSVLSSLLIGDREPLVSSLNGMMISRDQTRNTLQRDKSADSGRGQTMTRDSNSTRFPQSASSDKHAFKELQEAYERLELQLNQESKKHEEQMRHNTVVMMEMQDTINELQRELTALGRASSRMRPPSDGTTQQAPPESAIMFTRLDSERNSKIMKRAVNDERLEPSKYKDAVTTMDKYVSLPAKRFGHLVRKYVHHSRMKEIEENVKKSKSLDENVFDILDKMEALQNQRAKRWADKMDEMGSERLRLASLLMETLDSIEQESGIFLIKPMYSYRGREIKERYAGKLTRPVRPHRVVSPSREISAFAPAPTPASNIRGITRQQVQAVPEVGSQQVFRKELPPPLEGDETGIMGSPALAYATAAQRQTWNLSSSQVRGDGDNLMNSTNTPRILELDINRMLIGQNTISSKYGIPGLTDDRLINASQNNLRSYVTVNRPTVSLNRPRSYTGVKDVPPSSPVTRSLTSNSAGHKRVRVTESEISTRHSMTSTPPLPPISAHEGSDLREPPRSPPGSSVRVSTPPHIREVISPLK